MSFNDGESISFLDYLNIQEFTNEKISLSKVDSNPNLFMYTRLDPIVSVQKSSLIDTNLSPDLSSNSLTIETLNQLNSEISFPFSRSGDKTKSRTFQNRPPQIQTNINSRQVILPNSPFLKMIPICERLKIKKNPRSRTKEIAYPSGIVWKCVDCGVGEKETPLKRKGPDGKRNICNACYVRGRVRVERAERGTSRPVLPLNTLISPLNKSPISPSSPVNPFYLSKFSAHTYSPTNYSAFHQVYEPNYEQISPYYLNPFGYKDHIITTPASYGNDVPLGSALNIAINEPYFISENPYYAQASPTTESTKFFEPNSSNDSNMMFGNSIINDSAGVFDESSYNESFCESVKIIEK